MEAENLIRQLYTVIEDIRNIEGLTNHRETEDKLLEIERKLSSLVSDLRFRSTEDSTPQGFNITTSKKE